jgi:2-octaprenyl-6-methoxyphenol hydroxylase
VAARLVIGADGRNSLSRQAAGIAAETWTYDQSALTCTFTHQRSHNGVSTEFHRTGGPLTVVPAPGCSSNLVWVERPAVARRLAEIDDTAFREALEARLQGLLGPVEEVSARRLFPLSGLKADAAGQNRVALVGEAAHVLPPIGAQGLNLGLRDAAILADCIGDALKQGRDLGGPETLTAYTRARSFDIATRAWSIDVLNRSLISGFLPVQIIRGLGLHALKAIGPLRRLAIREGLAPSFVTPRLMLSEGDSTTHTS